MLIPSMHVRHGYFKFISFICGVAHYELDDVDKILCKSWLQSLRVDTLIADRVWLIVKVQSCTVILTGPKMTESGLIV